MKLREGSLGQRKIDRRLKHISNPRKMLKHKGAVNSGLDKLQKKRMKDDPDLDAKIKQAAKYVSEGSAGLRRLRRLVKKKRTADREARLAYKKYHSLNRGAERIKDRAKFHGKFFGGDEKERKALDISKKVKSSAMKARRRLEPLIAPRDDEDFADKEYGRTNRRSKDIKRLDMTGRLRRMARQGGDDSSSYNALKRKHLDDLKASKKMDRVSKYPKLP